MSLLIRTFQKPGGRKEVSRVPLKHMTASAIRIERIGQAPLEGRPTDLDDTVALAQELDWRGVGELTEVADQVRLVCIPRLLSDPRDIPGVVLLHQEQRVVESHDATQPFGRNSHVLAKSTVQGSVAQA